MRANIYQNKVKNHATYLLSKANLLSFMLSKTSKKDNSLSLENSCVVFVKRFTKVFFCCLTLLPHSEGEGKNQYFCRKSIVDLPYLFGYLKQESTSALREKQ
jgi:hypothetical protein